MRIGQLARHSGCSVETIRYYEAEGLLAAVRRSASGYRDYGYTDLMVDGAPSPHQSDTTLRWLIDRLRS